MTPKPTISQLSSLNALIVDGPKLGGIFKVRLSSKDLPEEERDMLLHLLQEQTDLIAFVTLTR